MATHVNEIVGIYQRAKNDLKMKYSDFSDDFIHSLAKDSITPNLREDEYSVLIDIDNLYTNFMLKNMILANLVSRLGNMGYKITQPDKSKMVIVAEKNTDKDKLVFSFNCILEHSIELIVPDWQSEPEIKSFLEELYSPSSTKKAKPQSMSDASPMHEGTDG